MSNYNKVKTEGVEEIEKIVFDPLVHTKDGKTWLEKEQVKSFLSIFAEKVHKATLEDVLEFVGEDEEDSMFMSSAVAAKNSLRRQIRDYIKTLTK